MPNAQEKRVTRIAETKGYRLEKVGKGTHHGPFALVHSAQGSRVNSGVVGAEFSFSLEEVDAWLAKVTK